MTDQKDPQDRIAKLDALAERTVLARPDVRSAYAMMDDPAGDGQRGFYTGDADFIVALVNAYPALRAELLAAREVCEVADRVGNETLDEDLIVKVADWRAARENTRPGTLNTRNHIQASDDASDVKSRTYADAPPGPGPRTYSGASDTAVARALAELNHDEGDEP